MLLLFLEEDECTPNPCKNNGKCLLNAVEDESLGLEMNDTSESAYICVCPPGFTGKLCETGMKE